MNKTTPDYAASIASIPVPDSIRELPVDPVRKMPVPWFVQWVDGKPEFRAADQAKLIRAVREKLCWVCGQPLNNRVTFLIGPMCVVNRISAEPPSHPDCAIYSARACPFLSRPHMDRREAGLPPEATSQAGIMIKRNPGVTCLWTTRSPGFHLVRDGGGVLFRVLPPTAVTWWAEGRTASRAEVLASVESGLPILRGMAAEQGEPAQEALTLMLARAESFWPPLVEATS
jgi:hypothetical protein